MKQWIEIRNYMKMVEGITLLVISVMKTFLRSRWCEQLLEVLVFF